MLTFVRSARAIALGPVITAGVCTSLIVVARLRPDSDTPDKILNWWGVTMLRVCGTTLEIETDMDFDADASYVIVSNHQSNIDIMANFVAADVPIRFLAKKELFRIPIFGPSIRAIGMVEVNRTAGAGQHLALNRAAKDVIARKHSLMVYPEGTRSREGYMKTFKKGAFLIAVEGQLPIVPMTISGAEQAWPAGGLVRGGTVRVHIGKPIETTGLGTTDVAELTRQIHSAMEQTHQELALGAS